MKQNCITKPQISDNNFVTITCIPVKYFTNFGNSLSCECKWTKKGKYKIKKDKQYIKSVEN